MAKKKRRENDFYPTPPELALAICQRLDALVTPKGVIEPSAGTGVFIKAARQVWPETYIVGVDIDPTLKKPILDAGANDAMIVDWEEIAALGFIDGVLILGNPPFSLAIPHIQAGINGLKSGDYMAMLLRMSILGSRKRVEFWKANPARYLIPLVPRPNFMPSGSDNSEYGVFVWQKHFRGNTEILPTLIWKD